VKEEKKEMTEIYARADWYLERPEPEMEWKGILEERAEPLGPNTRGALLFTLVTDQGRFPVYAANVEQKLAPYLGDPVIVRGKLVDLSKEGFGQELWIASLMKNEAPAK